MLLDRVSQWLSQARGFPALLAVGLVILNFVLQFVDIPVVNFLSDYNVFLHLAVIIGFMGILLADALGAW